MPPCSAVCAFAVLSAAPAAALHAAPLRAAGRLVRPRVAGPPVATFDLSLALYEANVAAEGLVASQLQQLTPVSAAVLYGAGLLTSLSPCCLSMLPLTFAYIGGLEAEADAAGDAAPRSALLPAATFSAGLAFAFAALGTAAATLGMVYGESSDGALLVLRAAVSLLAVGMGLNLLQVLPWTLPSLQLETSGLAVPRPVRTFLFGASSALVASPCASPVLATILGYVATLGDPLLGCALLSAYTLGYTTPVLATALLATSAREVSASMEGSATWFAPVSGAALLSYGTYSGLVTAFGPV